MANNFTAIHNIISKAAAEAGIREKENYRVIITGIDNDLVEFVLETEWMSVTCYADMESTRILGLMSEAKAPVYPKAA